MAVHSSGDEINFDIKSKGVYNGVARRIETSLMKGALSNGTGCVSNWSCHNWSLCSGGSANPKPGADVNHCAIPTTNEPPTTQSCLPAAPTGLSASAVSYNEIDLTWAVSNNATSYNVYRSLTIGNEADPPIAIGISDPDYQDYGLSSLTHYFYKVKAVNDGGISGFSNEATATSLAPPASPGLDVYSVAGNYTWTAPDGVYFVEVLVVGGGGAGGYDDFGGGGAGGQLVHNMSYAVTPGNPINVVVGAGGTVDGSNGQDSVFGNITASGGGNGGDAYAQAAAGGGGGGNYGDQEGDFIYPPGADGINGYQGGNGMLSFWDNTQGAGGGGEGAGGAGQDGSYDGEDYVSGNGADGAYINFDGTSWDGYYASGGAGGSSSGVYGANGQGGYGGDGGAGGSFWGNPGGANGGDGVVIIKH